MGKHHFILLAILMAVCSIACAQQQMTAMFYNTENLFDTAHDPGKNDSEFTPNGEYRWNNRRYWDKLDAVAKVVAAVGDDMLPSLVGLCEVENDRVMTDLTTRSALKGASYSYVMTDSPDRRGIDVALMYRRREFQLLAWESIPVDMEQYGESPTRDILHATGRIASMDTVDVYVCHWPSRVGGEQETQNKRMEASRVLRKSVDVVLSKRRKPYIIIMGDLNDGTSSPAVVKGLGAVASDLGSKSSDGTLVTLMDKAGGSYRYQGQWDQYDQFIVSASFMNGLGCCNIDGYRVCRFDFLLEDDNAYGGRKPYRTFNGRRYQAGYSDHLPIAFTFSF